MAEDRAQRRLAAILAADVVGFSRMMEADEAATLAALKARRKQVLEPMVAKHQGRVFKVTGDGVLVEFASAVSAVQCAVDLQQAFAEANKNVPDDRRIVLRIGVNLGDVMVEGGDLYGDGVNIAARLEAIAEPGGILVAGTAHDHIGTKIKTGFEDIGSQTLKNIAQPVRAYRVMQVASPSVPSSKPAAKDAPLRDKPSIAVLPFTNMSGDPEHEYFSDGITEDIITELSRFRSLFVIARNSSFVYKGRAADVIEVGKALGVRYVVEGSVRRADNRVRITAQLVDAQTGSHLWAERFDRELKDIFEVQDEVTRNIVTRIAPVLAAESLRMAKRKPPDDMQAYDLFLKAKVLIDVARTIDDLREGREFCNQAIRVDPTFARAHAYRAISYTIGIMTLEAEDLDEWRRQSLQSAEQAVALDAADAWSHWAMAEATFLNRQFDRTRNHMSRALSLNPNDADVLSVFGFVRAAMGDTAQALRDIDMALERNPSVPAWYNWAKGGILFLMGRYADALRSFEAYGQPNASIHRWRAAALVKLGRIEEAKADMKALLAARPKLNVAIARAMFDYIPNSDDFVETLRQAGLPDERDALPG
jgi:TolB-like protein/class 3 adenylate cyclase